MSASTPASAPAASAGSANTGVTHAPNSQTTALLVIDVQASFTARPFWQETHLAAYLAAQNQLIEGFSQQGWPIVRVFHQAGPEVAGNPFSQTSGMVQPLAGLAEFSADITVHKQRHSALVGTGLGDWLKAQGLKRLVISGIRTEQCCETTTRHASDEGWEVDFVPEATLTFPMQTPSGEWLSAEQIVERTATVLAGRFATLCTAQQALARAQAAAQPQADQQASEAA